MESATMSTTMAATPRVMPAINAVKSPAVKFSDNLQRWQLINTVRKSPVEAQIKRVIDLLFESRRSFTAEQINEACYVDVKGNKAVLENLVKNPKVSYDGICFSYKSTLDIRGQEELLCKIKSCVDGIAVADLKDAYPVVMQDLQALKAGGQIWVITTIGSKEGIAYPNNLEASIKVDDELKQLFQAIELPRDMMDIERELLRNRMKPAVNMVKRREMAQACNTIRNPKKKAQKNVITKKTKLTNPHLSELLRNL